MEKLEIFAQLNVDENYHFENGFNSEDNPHYQEPKKLQHKRMLPKYEDNFTNFIQKNELMKSIENEKRKIQDPLFLPLDECEALLICYNFNVNDILSLASDPENFELSMYSLGIKALVQEENTLCDQCQVLLNSQIKAEMRCLHHLCKNCFLASFNAFISNPNKNKKWLCSHIGCQAIIFSSLIGKYLTDIAYQQYQGYLIEIYISLNSKIKKCPSCNSYIERSDDPSNDIYCKCGYIFCGKCLNRGHFPLSCENARRKLDNNQVFLDHLKENRIMCNCGILSLMEPGSIFYKCHMTGLHHCIFCQGPFNEHMPGCFLKKYDNSYLDVAQLNSKILSNNKEAKLFVVKTCLKSFENKCKRDYEFAQAVKLSFKYVVFPDYLLLMTELLTIASDYYNTIQNVYISIMYLEKVEINILRINEELIDLLNQMLPFIQMVSITLKEELIKPSEYQIFLERAKNFAMLLIKKKNELLTTVNF